MSHNKDVQALLTSLTAEYAMTTSSFYRTPEDFNRLVRSRLIPRTRFNHDHHDTCMYIERSKNLNVVAYTANLCDAATHENVKSGEGHHCVIRAKDPIHAYFINLEPSYVAERRRKGIEYDCDDLNALERRLAYGCSASPLVTATMCASVPALAAMPAELQAEVGQWWAQLHPFVAHFVALPTWPGVCVCLPPLEGKVVAPPAEAEENAAAAAKAEEVDDEETLQAEREAAIAEAEVDARGEGAPEVKTEGESVAKEPSSVTTEPVSVPPELPSPDCSAFPEQDTVTAIITNINGVASVMCKVYVKSIEPKRFYQLPSVEYIEMYGIALETGELTYQKLVK